MRPQIFKSLVPAGVALLALIALGAWLASGPGKPLTPRVPGTDKAPGAELGGRGNAVLAGKLLTSTGKPAGSSGSWSGFRGPNRDGISHSPAHLAHSLDGSGWRELWAVDVGDGYAGAAVLNGRVYLMDYDREHKQDALRCLSFDDGSE